MKITHEDVESLIPVEEVREIFKSVAQESQAMKLLTKLPNMSSKQTKLKVEKLLPVAYWQESSTSRKKLTKMAWKNKFIEAEELAVIIPIAEADLDDADYDIWGEIKPKLVEAMANKIDAAIFFGEDKPSSFPEGIVKQAISAGHAVALQSGVSMYKLISDAMGLVEDDGYDVNGILGGTNLKKVFRDMTDTTGQLITGDEISALPRAIVKNGAFDLSVAKAVVGDFKEAVFAVRQDMKYKLLTEGVIQDPSTGEILYNLGQDDMVALRVTFRLGWQLPNPVNRINPDDDARLPFAAVVPTAGVVDVSLNPGTATTFEDSQVVSMSANVAEAKIYYTDNGDTPTAESTLYEGPITLTATKTIKAIAIREGYTSGNVKSVTYTKASAE